MKYYELIQEVGLIETGIVLSKYENDISIMNEAKSYIFADRQNYMEIIDEIIDKLNGLEKKNLLLLSPEIAFLEKLAECDEHIANVYVSISNDIDDEMYTRISENMPKGINITLIRESQYPQNFNIKDSAIIVFGYSDYNHAIIQKTHCRMMELYKAFCGDKFLVSCNNERLQCNPYNWTKVRIEDFFNNVL